MNGNKFKVSPRKALRETDNRDISSLTTTDRRDTAEGDQPDYTITLATCLGKKSMLTLSDSRQPTKTGSQEHCTSGDQFHDGDSLMRQLVVPVCHGLSDR